MGSKVVKPTNRIEILENLWIGLKTDCGSVSLYPIMRLLLPQASNFQHRACLFFATLYCYVQLDRKRSGYGFRENKIAETLIAALGIAHTSKDAQSLLHFSDPRKHFKKACLLMN